MSDRTFLTTKELASLLRVKERKVYDLVAGGAVPYRRITGKLLFPKDEIDQWLAGSAGASMTQPVRKTSAHALQVVAGSHDPLLEWALRESGSGLAALFDGSLDGAERLAAREAVAACLHIYEPETEDWNVGFAREGFASEPVVLLAFAVRSRGLLVPPDNPLHIQSMADLKGKRVALRQPRAGGRVLFDQLLAKAGLAESDLVVTELLPRTETEAALTLLSGKVDAAIGLQAMAEQFRLGFVPIMQERYDLLVFRRAFFEQPLQQLFRFFRSPSFTDRAAGLSGYDLSELGSVRFNGL